MARPKSNLSAREAAFVHEYLVDLNATAAAQRAGYGGGEGGWKKAGSLLMSRPRVKLAIDEALSRRADRVEVKADDVLRTLLRLLGSDVRKAFGPDGCLLPVAELPDDVALAISSVEVDEIWEGRGKDRTQTGVTRKVKFWSKDRAIELALRHLGLLIERKDVNVHHSYEDLVAGSYEKGERFTEVAGHG